MLLFLVFNRHALFADWAVLFQFEILPADPLAVLLVESDGSDPLVTFRAEHGENGALTSWHNWRTLGISWVFASVKFPGKVLRAER